MTLRKDEIMNKLSESAIRMKRVHKAAGQVRAALVAEGGDTIKPPATGAPSASFSGLNNQGSNNT